MFVCHSSLLPGQKYTVDVLTQSGLRPEDLPSTSHSSGPLHFWTSTFTSVLFAVLTKKSQGSNPIFFLAEPLPPQNLSLSHVSSSTARVTWDRHPRSISDGFVVNVTRGLTTRSRFLPDGTLSMYTIRELSPGQHYRLALTAVRNTGPEQIHSEAQHLAFTTRESQGSATVVQCDQKLTLTYKTSVGPLRLSNPHIFTWIGFFLIYK